MTKLTISESALALILLENELDNNFQDVRRWQRRVDEAQQSLNEAKSRLTRNQELLMKANISRNEWTYNSGNGYNGTLNDRN